MEAVVAGQSNPLLFLDELAQLPIVGAKGRLVQRQHHADDLLCERKRPEPFRRTEADLRDGRVGWESLDRRVARSHPDAEVRDVPRSAAAVIALMAQGRVTRPTLLISILRWPPGLEDHPLLKAVHPRGCLVEGAARRDMFVGQLTAYTANPASASNLLSRHRIRTYPAPERDPVTQLPFA